jgi:retinol dehydrogenase-12
MSFTISEMHRVLTHDVSIQVNHLSTSLLTLRLLPLMKRTASEHGTHPTVTIVSSEVHHEVKLPKAVTDQPNVMKALSDPKTA